MMAAMVVMINLRMMMINLRMMAMVMINLRMMMMAAMVMMINLRMMVINLRMMAMMMINLRMMMMINWTMMRMISFDLASERESKAPVTSLSRVATVLCLYVIAHTSCVIYSRMLLSMFPLLFAAQAYPWAPFDLVSDGDLFQCPFSSSLFLFDLVSSSAHSAFLTHACVCIRRHFWLSRYGMLAASALLELR